MSQPDDPQRLTDAAARSELGELFASASRDVPSDEQLARIAAGLGPLLDEAPGAAPGSPGRATLVKLGVAAGTAALLVGVALTLRGSSKPAPASVSRAVAQDVAAPALDSVAAPPPSPSSPVPVADLAASARDGETAQRLESATASPKSSSAPAKPLSEAGLLEQARRVLNRSPSSALLLANQHAARFPNGLLVQEREVIAIEALRRLQRTSEAERRAAGFAKAFPGSAHQRMVNEPTPKQ